MASHPYGPGFHHVAIRATDFEATVRFYTEGLGFRRTYGWGEGDRRAVMLDTGDGNYLEVFAGGKRNPATDPTTEPEGAILHYALRVPDITAAYERALAAGAISRAAPKSIDIAGDRPLVFQVAFVYGLNGEVIEFFTNDEL